MVVPDEPPLDAVALPVEFLMAAFLPNELLEDEDEEEAEALNPCEEDGAAEEALVPPAHVVQEEDVPKEKGDGDAERPAIQEHAVPFVRTVDR